MKTCLDTRTRSKNPRRRVQMVPEHESGFDIQKHHWELLECRNGIFSDLAQWLSSDDKAHAFRSFRKRLHSDSHPNRPCLFFRVF